MVMAARKKKPVKKPVSAASSSHTFDKIVISGLGKDKPVKIEICGFNDEGRTYIMSCKPEEWPTFRTDAAKILSPSKPWTKPALQSYVAKLRS